MLERIAFAAAMIALPLLASAETFRCGKWIVSSDMTLTEFSVKCGAPSSHESRTEDVRVRNHNTGLMELAGQTTIETWVYDRGTQAAPMVVTIIDGRIKSIERLKK